MKQISIAFLMAVTFSATAQKSPNYISYHKKINGAEILFFMEGKVDGALALYEEVFNTYDFIFVKDLVNAAQIAHFSNKPYKKYLKRGFEFGLKFAHLKNYPIFQAVLAELENDTELQEAYRINRKKYIENIDYEYLNLMYQRFIRDQLVKGKDNYDNIIRATLKNFKRIIEKKGFPGARLIGISDSTIFAEKGIPQLDMKKRIKKYGDELWYVETADKSLMATIVFPMLVHHPCSYFKMKNLLWEEMKKGNIHPRDLGMLYDNIYRGDYIANYCDPPEQYAYFRLTAFLDYPEKTEENIATTNALRKSFYIVPLAVDFKKKEFEEKYGFVLFTRFFAPLKKPEPAWK